MSDQKNESNCDCDTPTVCKCGFSSQEPHCRICGKPIKELS